VHGPPNKPSIPSQVQRRSKASGLLEPGWPALQFCGGFLLTTPVERDQRLVALMPKLTIGWVKTVGGQIVAQHLGLVAESYSIQDRKALGDCDANFWPTENDPWHHVQYLSLQPIAGGAAWTFAAITRAEHSAVGDLCGRYGRHLHSFPSQLPVVELRISEQWPQFEIVGWAEKSACW
jgi:hypothetical protein